MAPDFERLALTPWPIACWASSGTRLLSSALACSCSRWADRVREKVAVNSAQALDEVISNNTDCLDPGLRRVHTEKGRGLSAFDTAPELPLGRDDEMLVKRIGMGLDLDPFAAAAGSGFRLAVSKLRRACVEMG
jgi:hypothetical protein